MKVYIRITDEEGNDFEGEVDASPVARSSTPKLRATKRKGKRAAKTVKAASTPVPKARLEFSKPERAFIKTYAHGLSGPKKFVLVLSFITKGEEGKEVEVKEVEKRWNKMKAPNLLGTRYNGKYPTVAKEHGWVDTPRHGVYVLTASWKEMLAQDNE